MSSMGEAIVQRLLAAHMGQVYNCLRDQNKSKTIKSAVTLLIAMVLLSDKSKKTVLARLNFGHQNFPPLFKRRNRKDPQDVRSCMVLLTLAFLLDSDNAVITVLVQQKTFLQFVIAGLMYDSKEVVVDTLATLMDKVVKCPGVSKTDKIKLFSEVTLKQICELFNWKGPTGWTAGKKSKSQEELIEADEGDKQVVASVAFNFLTELCCSHKHGINFYDKTVGTGNRTHNQLLAHFLDWLVKKIDEEHIADLVTSILCTCPDLIKSVLNSLSPSFSPRWSDKWSKLMDWLAKLYGSIPDKLLTQPEMLYDANAIVSIATVFCLPPPKVAVILQQSVKHEDIRVRHKVFQVVMALAMKASNIKTELSQRLCADKTNKLRESILDLFTANVFMMLPTINQIFVCVDKVMQKISQNDKKDEEVLDVGEHINVILQVLTLYQHISPTLVSEKPKDLAKLIEMVSQEAADINVNTDRDEDDHEEKPRLLQPQFYLLKLLSGIDAKLLSLGREGMIHKLLSLASHSGQYKNTCVGLICKMLKSVEIFSHHEKELYVWIETALRNTNTEFLKESISFLANSLSTLINNPAPYLDRLLEVIAGLDMTDGNTLETAGSDKNTLNDILAMDMKLLDKKLAAFEPSSIHICDQTLNLYLSPLALVVLDNLESNTKVAGSIKTYISRVFVQLVYTIASPQTLARVLSTCKTTLDGNVLEYIFYWLDNKIWPCKLKPLSAETYGTCSYILMRVFFGQSKLEMSSSTVIDQLTQELKALDTAAKLNVLRQVVFYLTETARRPQSGTVCQKVLIVFTSIAEILIDELAAAEKWDEVTAKKDQSEQSSDMSLLVNELQTAKLNYSHSELSNVSHPMNNAKEEIIEILQNTSINSLIFPKCTQLRDLKNLDNVHKVACLFSKFMNTILMKCKTWTWFASEKELLKTVVFALLASMKEVEKTSDLYTIYLNLLNTVYPMLDLIILSRCITQMLKMPLSDFFEEGSSEETETFRVLCLLLQQWVHLIEIDPSFTSSTIFQQLTQKSHSTKSHNPPSNNCYSCAIRVTFSIEETTSLSPTEFVPLFELLTQCQNSQFLNVVLFVVTHLSSEVVHHIGDTVLYQMLGTQMSLKAGATTELIVACLIENDEEFYLKSEKWMQANASKVFRKKKWNLIRSYLTAFSRFSEKNEEIMKKLKKAALEFLTTDNFDISCKELLHIYQQLSEIIQSKDQHFQAVLAKAMLESIKSHDVPDKCNQFAVLLLSSKFAYLSSDERKKSTHKLLDLLLKHLTHLTSSKTNRHTDTETYILDSLPQLIPDCTDSTLSFLHSYWNKLVTNTLRFMFMNTKLLKVLCQLVPFVYASTTTMTVVNAQTMFQMCVNHTGFMNVMMTKEHTEVKSELVHLLHLLGDKDPSVYETHLSKVLVGSYNATLSETDQRLLDMIKKCQKDSKKFECPSVWGKTAIERHTVSKVLGPTLDKEASVKSILEQIDQRQMQESILHFPLRRTQMSTNVTHAREFKSKPTCYDPNFFLPLFVQILSPDKLVPLRLFVEKGCLSYLLIALSSHDIKCRRLAYHALNDFHDHAEGSRWQERLEVNYVLDLINGSRDQDAQKLPYVIALFFARVVKILLYPADPLYVPLFKFFVAKSEIDLRNIPEFYQLFFSPHLQYKQERNWLLSLLSDGLRETSDYWIYQKKLIFKILFCYYDSSISDFKSQELILKTLQNASQEKFIAVDLVRKHGLMSWLLNVSKGLSRCPDHTELVCDLVHTLWITLATMNYATSSPGTLTKPGDGWRATEVDNDIVEEDVEMQDENKDRKLDKKTKITSGQSANVPTSTKVEMGLVVKCIIWTLRNPSNQSLLKLLEVMNMLLSPDTQVEPTLEWNRKTVCCVSLSSVEASLLLYHAANILQLPRIAVKAAELLKQEGVVPETLLTKVTSRPEITLTKRDHSKTEDVTEADDLNDDSLLNNTVGELTDELFKTEQDADLHKTFSFEEKQKLLYLVCRISNVTRTLQFV
ncbi:nucleolar pre-ribosomal-associated protein 1-like isoform X2 [Biomphalaria glabrata]|nr:nucleolar pre-ribosomal-associated protein 1-like isoform X2 [Biomphalaria glabrata]XP_055863711.1 nucleolar pre-ribosomal-associated protein 1-like isoform X2 [Biomphalaria glabrata]